MEFIKFRSQFDEPLDVRLSGFSPSTVQPGMSPSISQMVKTRTVGGNLDEYQMNGIESDAPFESEYLDYFDIEDMIQNDNYSPAVERQNAEESSPGKEAPPNNESADNQQVSEKSD